MSITDDIAANLQQARLLPTFSVALVPGSALATALQNDSFFIQMYEITAALKETSPRFLATMGVFTCVSVWAWSPMTKRAFAAHVPSSACHFAAGKDPRAKLLPEITHYMKWTFRKERIEDVRVTLVGGQKAQNTDATLRRTGHGFDWHVTQAIRDAGIQHIDDRLFHIFPGIAFHRWFEQEQAAKHQSFHLVALDRATGAVVVHTKTEIPGMYSVRALGARGEVESQRYADTIQTLRPEGQRCVWVDAP